MNRKEGWATDEQVPPVGWVSLHKVASERTEDPRLQAPHQLSLVIQQLFPFGFDKISLPRILIQTRSGSCLDDIYALKKRTKDTFDMVKDYSRK